MAKQVSLSFFFFWVPDLKQREQFSKPVHYILHVHDIYGSIVKNNLNCSELDS